MLTCPDSGWKSPELSECQLSLPTHPPPLHLHLIELVTTAASPAMAMPKTWHIAATGSRRMRQDRQDPCAAPRRARSTDPPPNYGRSFAISDISDTTSWYRLFEVGTITDPRGPILQRPFIYAHGEARPRKSPWTPDDAPGCRRIEEVEELCSD
jgi:hypothetical protein